MARAIWKGHISFGLVSIPIQLYSAEKRNELRFHLIDRRNGARVRYQRVNEATGEEVGWNDIVKGYEVDDDGDYVLLNDDDFKRAAPEASQSIDIEEFVDAEEIELRYCDKPYYLLPGKKGEKGYVLLRETLREKKKVAVAKVVIRTKEYLAAVHAMGEALVLVLLRFADDLRNINDFEFPQGDLDDYNVSDKELKMAGQLIESMAGEFQPERYHDSYQARLLQYIEEKSEKGERATSPAAAEEEASAGDVVNIMDLLQQSLDEKKKKPARKSSRKKRKSSGGRKRAS